MKRCGWLPSCCSDLRELLEGSEEQRMCCVDGEVRAACWHTDAWSVLRCRAVALPHNLSGRTPPRPLPSSSALSWPCPPARPPACLPACLCRAILHGGRCRLPHPADFVQLLGRAALLQVPGVVAGQSGEGRSWRCRNVDLHNVIACAVAPLTCNHCMPSAWL